MLRPLALVLAAAFALAGPAARAAPAPVAVAVAANFTAPAKEIAAAFQAATGVRTALSFGASGQFFAQITHGAPYEVFLSADVERAAKLEGAAGARGRFVYARGRLALYSATTGRVDARGAVLRRPGAFDKLAIADPAAAPYGQAAVETMRKLGVYDALRPKLVQGASITQAFDFTRTGAAQLGFVALSQVIGVHGGSLWIVPEGLHAPIDQAAVLLAPGANDPAAHAFLEFLKGPKARAIIHRYGYATP